MDRQWTVSAAGRLDSFLAAEVPGVTRSAAQKLIERGRITVNGKTVEKSSQRLKAGDTVELVGHTEIPRESDLEPADLALPILYEDAACFVINKPAGIAMHPGSGMPREEKTILHGVAHLFGMCGLPFSEDAVLVHRLDRETTGCLLIAKTRKAHDALQQQFESRTICKMYLALVSGIPSPAEAIIEAPIGRHTTDRTKMAVTRISGARHAKTTYYTLAAHEKAALLLCDLHTGRTHQVRVHLSSIGHPVLGDPTYATDESRRLAHAWKTTGMCLHAWKLRFRSPDDGKEQDITAPLPDTFKDVLQCAGIDAPLSKTWGRRG